jgi:hypothetical protein
MGLDDRAAAAEASKGAEPGGRLMDAVVNGF